MGWWEEHVLPRAVDLALRGHEVGEVRRTACAPLSGRVLEIGFGSGLNVRWYPAAVTAVDAVEPSDRAWAMSARRRARSLVPVTRIGLDGQDLAAPDAAYDAVLCTFTLCTVPDPARVLAEVTRVLRPGGTFAFLEHGLAPTAGVRRWQRRLEPLQRRVAGGCHLTRDPGELVRASGLELVALSTDYFTGLGRVRPLTYGYLGRARA